MKTLIALAFAASAAMAQTNPAAAAREAAMKADLAGQIDGMKKQAQVMVDSVYSFGEWLSRHCSR